ncbi:MAG: helix-hairpin-helix domain-containing protein, partial [Bacteroidales bacterium]|nr:helix-hairpin-helix domain-containing protein [Bacteroidales bacterium]
MVRKILLLVIVSVAFQSIAQISDSEESIELILEYIAQQNEDYDFTEVINELEFVRQNPINLNSATKDELGQLLFLSDYQILSILNYRRRSGGFISIYELQYIPGFNSEFVALLTPYFFVGEKSTTQKVNWNRVPKDGNHSVMLETGRVFQQQKGYIEKVFTDGTGKDSIAEPSFKGDPYKVKIRYDFRFYNKIQAGILLEKDPGEKIRFDRGVEVLDYNSAHIKYR